MAQKKAASKAGDRSTKKRPAPAPASRSKPARSAAPKASAVRPAPKVAPPKPKAEPKAPPAKAAAPVKRPVTAAAAPKHDAKATKRPVAAPEPKSDGKPAKRATGKTAPPAGASRPARPIDVDPPLPKTNLNATQLAMFKEMLLEKRRELLGDVRTLTKDALGRSRQDSSGDLSSMPIHMADLGTDNWEQDFTLGLIANEQQLVREIDEALQRIEDRTYGICLATHKPIAIARLKAKPWAKHCIEYARQRELGRY